MKIAIFHNLLAGGAKRVVYEQLKYLSRKYNIDVYELTSLENNYLNLNRFAKNVYRYDFQIENNLPSFISRLYKDYKNFYVLDNLHKKISKDINEKEYDIVIVHPDRFTQAPFLLKYLKTKKIYFCEEWLRIVYEKEYQLNEKVGFVKGSYEKVTRYIRKYIDKKNAESADIIVGNSNFTIQNIKKVYNSKILVCPLGVDYMKFRPTSVKKKYDLLFIGEKVKIEGYSFLENAILLIKKKLIIKILDRDPKKNFKLSEKNLIREYNKAKIVLALSMNEPFGLIPLEAMACGTPVIALNEGGYKETIKNGITGYLIKKDAKELAVKIELLMENYKLMEKMGNQAREYILKSWTWEKHNIKLEQILLKLAGK